ncbi:putative serine protease K12H4.7 [Calliphora vicina]|uniref:putative serine protease K12H4.7 n=1 Tax=Calliphora vicina TaxID=7373 RepID=UPI00325A52CD
MFNLIPVYILALQLLNALNNVSCLMPRKINPYQQVFKIMLREPPINPNNTHKDYKEIKEKWLQQPLNHFDANNTETWMMRYFVNDEFYQTGAPVFVFVGGEWEIFPHMLKSGHFYDMARQQAAVMFYTEHRYYGQSWPRSNSSTNNLQYLNVLQSLADLKYFLTYQKSSAKALENSKVVLVGGSYSGSMVAWFMKLYPQMADVAWASSAPLRAKMDFNEYLSLTMHSLQQKGGVTCKQKLEEAFKGLVNIMQSSKMYSLLKRLKICQSFDTTNPLDRQAFFNGLGNYFASLVQSYSSLIPQFCLTFTKLDLNPTEALIKYLTQLFSTSDELKIREEEEWCLDFSYQGMQSIFTDVNEFKTGTRPWFYQTCHEFGWFSTTANSISTANTVLTTPTSTSAAFGGQVPLSYFQQLCQDVFGNFNNNAASVVGVENLGHGKEPQLLTVQQLQARALAINKLFGGFSNVSQHVIFTHGLLDPWRAAGIQYGHNVLLIKDYSHVEDMGSINLKDTVEMNVAKLKVASFINRILRYH